MRLWHQDLIEKLPQKQLLGQHSECCGLRGRGWGRVHSIVNYVFKNSYIQLFRYHRLIMEEMQKRGYKVSPEWLETTYRGKKVGYAESEVDFLYKNYKETTIVGNNFYIYSEHNKDYLKECIDNLKQKGIEIEVA